MNLTNREAILCTIAYADLFSYPLTSREVHYWSIGRDITVSHFQHKGIEKDGKYWMLKGRSSLSVRRARVEKASQKKWKRARRVGRILQFIPTIHLVGVSGGLAMNNAAEGDDIDLCIIACDGTVWMTRLLVTVLISMLGLRRAPNQKRVKDSICLNLYLTPKSMRLSTAEHDVYSAHEILQMKPLWWKGDMYKEFLDGNAWVQKLLPVAWKHVYTHAKTNGNRYGIWGISGVFITICMILEPVAFGAQMLYMRGKKTTERIDSDTIRFHPRDMRGWVRKEFSRRLQYLGVPLDKGFFAR